MKENQIAEGWERNEREEKGEKWERKRGNVKRYLDSVPKTIWHAYMIAIAGHSKLWVLRTLSKSPGDNFWLANVSIYRCSNSINSVWRAGKQLALDNDKCHRY